MSDPDAGHVREAASAGSTTSSSGDLFLTETAALANVVLPAASMLRNGARSPTRTGKCRYHGRQCSASSWSCGPGSLDPAGDGPPLGLGWSYGHPSEVWNEMRLLWPAVVGINSDHFEREGWAQYPCAAEDSPVRTCSLPSASPRLMACAKLVPVEPSAPAETRTKQYQFVFSLAACWSTRIRCSMTGAAVLGRSSSPRGLPVLINGRELSALGASMGDPLQVASAVAPSRPVRGLTTACRTERSSCPFCYAEAAANLLTNPALDPQSKIRNTSSQR